MGEPDHALVTVAGEDYEIADIGLRMLEPHELAAAQGFPASYQLHGTKAEQIAGIEKFHRYLDVDNDGIPWRTLPGVHPKGAYFTRGSGHNMYGAYTEDAKEYQAVVDRLRGIPSIAALRSAVIWLKGVSSYQPDYYVEMLPTSPWIHQPFEEYDDMRPDRLARKFAI